MTKFWFDTEFLEDGHTIEPISIGIVREDGEQYYAEFELASDVLQRIQAHTWLMANVVPHLDGDWKPKQQIGREIIEFTRCRDEPEFWGYCAAYDWVLLNQIYGPMVEHPKAWPFYCNDISQLALDLGLNRRTFPAQDSSHGAEHNALADARWTRDTYYWIVRQD